VEPTRGAPSVSALAVLVMALYYLVSIGFPLALLVAIYLHMPHDDRHP
jgi:hypothetical protein